MERAREQHWQREWHRAGLATGRRVPGREKFFAVVAYPGPSGFLHVGHLRGLTYADVLHRYFRMRGRQVFFPTGTHASGLPAVTFAQKVARREPGTIAQLRQHRVSEAEWASLEDPVQAARFLGEGYLRVFRELGLLIDEAAYVTTVDDDYQAFIRWQFGRLDRAGALVQAPYFASACPVCGPVSVDPSETDLERGGTAEWIQYTTVPFALEDGRILLTGTLRPETVYGVTNLWLHPTESLVVWHHGDRPYVVSRSGAELLIEQHGGRLGHEVSVAELIGRSVRVPLTDRSVPLLASRLVDPQVGTGLVMSVPAHAPVDWVAIHELSPEDRSRLAEIPVIIEVDPNGLSASERELLAGSGAPAERAARATHARSLNDTRQLEAATERLYRVELSRGQMTVAPRAGTPVAEARVDTALRLGEVGGGFLLHQFSEPVICRNGHPVVIRRVPDQWFLRYGEPDWKRKTEELVGRMTIVPPEYARELPEILAWFQDRPCTRRGRWLGTPFPRDPSWIIEPIADSTFYPAYFVIRRFVSSGRVPLAALTPAFFDYVFLGEGAGEPTVDRPTQQEIREEFEYWYPLDYNIGGKEHKRVHFPAFLYTHALLVPPAAQPRGLFVYWWLTGPGGAKVSKKDVASKGGSIPSVREAFDRWGADALRLFYALSASPFQDVEWGPELVEQAAARLIDVERTLVDARRPGSGANPELEAWLLDQTRGVVARVHQAMERLDFRELAQSVYVDLANSLRRYLVRGGTPGPAMARVSDVWVRLLSPVTPHLAEELGVGRFQGLTATESFPAVDELPASLTARFAEEYLERVEADLRSVLRASQARGEMATLATFYVAAPWKRQVELWLRESDPARAADLPRTILDRARSEPELAAFLAEIPQYVKRVASQLTSDAAAPPETFDEAGYLRSVEGFLVQRFGFAQVQVFPEAEGEAHDPKDRRRRARPGRPAFYLGHQRGVGAPPVGSGPPVNDVGGELGRADRES